MFGDCKPQVVYQLFNCTSQQMDVVRKPAQTQSVLTNHNPVLLCLIVCLPAAHKHDRWRCFFPQYNMYHISTYSLVVNSYVDPSAISIAYDVSAVDKLVKCLLYLTGSPSAQPDSSKNRAFCSRRMQAAVVSYSIYLRHNVSHVTAANSQVMSFVTRQLHHCSTVKARGRTLPHAVGSWYDKELIQEARWRTS